MFFVILLAALVLWLAFLVFVALFGPGQSADRRADDYPLLTEHRFFTR
jgi:hypothetical protein